MGGEIVAEKCGKGDNGLARVANPDKVAARMEQVYRDVLEKIESGS